MVHDKFRGAHFENVIDLCSLSNLSILLFIQPNRTIYIHGKNPFNTGEGNLALIYKKLELETQGKSRN